MLTMVHSLAVLMCLSAVSAARVTSKTTAKERGNSMIAKVIEMLGDEKNKVKADLAADEKTFQEKTEWCDDTSTELTFSIKTSKGKIEDLTAQSEDNSAQIAALDEEIAEPG